MTDWQPIETAPRDRTRILLWGALHGPKCDGDGKWERGEVAGSRVSLGYFGNALWQTGTFNSPPSPTHWMPLPTPPKQG
jgi:hypothetical protein